MFAVDSVPAPDPGANEDLRRWQRHAAAIPVDVTVFVNGARANYRGEAGDISRGGMRLFVPRELDPGTSITLEFAVPYQAVKFNLCGVIRNRSGFNHGVEFSNATPEQLQMIERTCKIFDLLR